MKSSKIVSEYDQEIPQSQTAVKPMLTQFYANTPYSSKFRVVNIIFPCFQINTGERSGSVVEYLTRD